MLAAAVGAIAACGESRPPAASLPLDDAGDAEAAAPDADLEAGTCELTESFGSPQCNECMQSTCCAVIGPCAADATCAELMHCVQGCADEPNAAACTRACEAQTSDERRLWRAVVDCELRRPCAVPCTSLGS